MSFEMNKYEIFQEKLNETDNLEELLETEAFSKDANEKLKELLNGENSASDLSFAGLTFGDFIYDALRVNPLVIEGADFARSSDLGNIFKFSLFSEDIVDLSGQSYTGNINQIKGYVGEKYVAQHLQSSGHEVEFPSTSNNPGFDLIVDGKPFQVKTTIEPNQVQEHLDKYPHIPVFVNEEVASEFSGNPMVYPVPKFSEYKIDEMTQASIDSGSELIDFEIFTFSTAVAAGRQVFRLYNGTTDLKNGSINFGYDLVGYAGGAKIGSIILATTGSLFAPFAIVVGGLFGAIAGGITGRQIAKMVKGEIHAKEEMNNAENKIKEFVKSAYKASNKSYSIFKNKSDIIKENLYNKGEPAKPLRNYSEKRLTDEEKYLDNRRRELQLSITDFKILDPSNNGLIVAGINALSLSAKAKVHPANVKDSLMEMFKALNKLKEKLEKL